MYASLPYIVIGVLLGFVVIHSYMSIRYGYNWIGNSARRFAVRSGLAMSQSVTELYNIPRVPYLDRFGQYTNIPKKKENAY
jgi:hypothetical protein